MTGWVNGFIVNPTLSHDNIELTVGWANGFIVNPTLCQYIVGLRKACSPTYAIVNPTLNQYIVGLRKACSPTLSLLVTSVIWNINNVIRAPIRF